MTDLEKLTTNVPATSLSLPPEAKTKNIDEIYNDLINTLQLSFEENTKFNEGVAMAKLSNIPLTKLMLECSVNIIDNSKKTQTSEKLDEALYQQNKKIVRDLANAFFTVITNYSYNDRELKLYLLGKLIQSLYGSR